MATVQTGTITTNVPGRLDRLPWSKFHFRVMLGLGTVWILDGLEVTMVGTVASRLTEPDSGLALTAGEIGLAGAIYIVGACLGALYFGHLTDRFGRKRLFLVTLAVYIVATLATAASWTPWWFFLARFFTGAGIGGEYAAINSAIDELIPARVRGRVDLLINGTYWLGSAAGSALAILFLDKALIPADIGWRLAFIVGVVLGFGILLVRRHVPESPRWLFIHGREDEAERIVGGIERDVVAQTGQQLDSVDDSITVRQRRTIPFRTIAETAVRLYPKRALLGFALFVGQAFIYNGITFNLGTLFSTFFGVASSFVPVFIIIYAIGNFLGPVLLGRLFDTIGRKPMIAGTYLGSAIMTIPLALLFLFEGVTEWGFILLVVATFFLASAGASAAYLTVSEIFPMETRALAIAFFYAIGTAVGGISGPLLFGELISSGSRPNVTIAFFIGAGVMAIGGIAELLLGVKAERAKLEDIALPLTAAEVEQPGPARSGPEPTPHRLQAQRRREEAEQSRARAAEHRARAIELRAEPGGEAEAALIDTLAEDADLRAREMDERAAAMDLLAQAEASPDEAPELAAQARAAEYRADALVENAAALQADDEQQAERHTTLAEAALERARAAEQRSAAERCHRDVAAAERGGSYPPEEAAEDDVSAEVSTVRATMHEAWSRMHEERAAVLHARAQGDGTARERHEHGAALAERQALAAEQRVVAAEHRVAAERVRNARATAEQAAAEREQAARREAEAEERDQRARERLARRQQLERSGLRRFRPGPGTLLPRARLAGLDVSQVHDAETALDTEIEIITHALADHGPTDREQLAQLVGARYWGPARFGAALRTAVAEGAVRRVSRRTYAPADRSDAPERSDGPADDR